MNQSVEQYFIEGCGRCPLGGTPDCKVHQWEDELRLLRNLVLDCGLTEESKWGVPCYTDQNKNILIVSAFKNYCSISFFKGVLLNNNKGLLVEPGPHSQAARLFKFTSLNDILKIESDIKAAIFEALEIEKAGLTIPFKKNHEPLPEELHEAFDRDPTLKTAFESLTPGRQRGYILHFSQPKQAKTRIARIEKCTSMILSGIGLHDKYQSRKKNQF